MMNESNQNESMYSNTNSMEFINSSVVGGSSGNMSSPMNQQSPSSSIQQQQQQTVSPTSSVTSAAASAVMGFALGNNNISLEPSALSHRVNAITSKIKELKDTAKIEETRSWRNFVGKREQYTLPAIKDTTSRIKENVVYYQSNYLILFLCFSCYFIVTNPFYLLLLGLLLFISVYINYLNTNLTDIQKKIAYAIQAFISLYFLLYAGSSIFWLIGATITITLLHAAFHVPNSTDDSTIQFGSNNL